MAPDPDAILQGCLRGDKRSWDGFVELYSRLIYWSIWKSLETRSIPNKEEVCRETFQEFFRRMLEPARLEKLAGVANIPKYLQVTAANLLSERFRRSGIVEKFEITEEGSDSEAPETDGAVSAERRGILESVLGSLKPNERKCLELHYLEGHTHKEIAGLLGLPQDTVSTLIRRTKEKLKERLRARGMEE